MADDELARDVVDALWKIRQALADLAGELGRVEGLGAAGNRLHHVVSDIALIEGKITGRIKANERIADDAMVSRSRRLPSPES